MEQSGESGLHDACACGGFSSRGNLQWQQTSRQLLWLTSAFQLCRGYRRLHSGEPLDQRLDHSEGLWGVQSRISLPCQLNPAELNDPADVESAEQGGRSCAVVVIISYLLKTPGGARQ
jgi:hypothetical protein